MTLRPTRMEVRLDNIRANYGAIRKHLDEHGGAAAKIFGVIKANAYNLGAVPVAWALREAGADYFIVATPDEALELRAGGIVDPVLVLGASPYEAAPEYVRYGIRATITDMEMAHALSAAAEKLGKKAFVHIKIDTGMGRIGFRPDEATETVARIAALPGVVCEGAFTHFATADDADLAYVHEQHALFLKALDLIAAKGITIPLRHCCNSGGTLSFPQWAMDGVRPGQIVCGMYPTEHVPRSLPVLPGFSFKTAVAALRTLPPGQGGQLRADVRHSLRGAARRPTAGVRRRFRPPALEQGRGADPGDEMPGGGAHLHGPVHGERLAPAGSLRGRRGRRHRAAGRR